jgi:hypothetical protein
VVTGSPNATKSQIAFSLGKPYIKRMIPKIYQE